MAYQDQLSIVNRSASSNKPSIDVPMWQPKMSLLDGLADALKAVRERNDDRLFWLEGECTNKVYKRFLRLVGMGVFFANEGPMNNNLFHMEANIIEATGVVESIECGPKVKAALLAIEYELSVMMDAAFANGVAEKYADCI